MSEVAWEAAEDIVLDIERGDAEVYYRVRCATDFSIYGNDFEYLRTILASPDSCDKLSFYIDKDDQRIFTGQLRLRKGEWDFDACKVTISPDQDDTYICLDGIMSEEVNVLPQLPGHTVTSGIGQVFTQTCSDTNTQSTPMPAPPGGCLANPGAFGMKRYTIEAAGGGNYLHTATWMREQVEWPCDGGTPVLPPGEGWTYWSGDCASGRDYARPPASNQVRSGPNPDEGLLWDQRWEASAYDESGNAVEYEGGVDVGEVLDLLLAECGLSVVSDFFDWNGPGTAPDNIAYARAPELGTLMLFQKSEIALQGASNRATRGDISLEALLRMLREMFQAYWVIEGTTMRLEHISYFTGHNGLDIESLYPSATEGQNIMRVITEQMPKREQFRWMDVSLTDAFAGSDLVYPDACGDPESEPVVHDPGPVSTDLAGIQSNPEGTDLDGWFMASTQGGAFTIVNDELNGALGWDYLVQSFYQHWRYAPVGRYENVDYLFLSVRPNWVQDEIIFPLPVDDFLTMDFSDRLHTGLGWGYIRQGTYRAGSCNFAVNLEY